MDQASIDRTINTMERAETILECETPDQVPLNLDLLRETVTWARKSHEVDEDFALKWDQSDWARARLSSDLSYAEVREKLNPETVMQIQENFCGTACCIAGNIAIKHGQLEWFSIGSHEVTASYMTTGETISDFAKEQLGITEAEADMLFEGTNTIDQVERIAEAIAQRRGMHL